MLNEVHQEVKGFRSQGHIEVSSAQTIALGVEFAIRENITHVGFTLHRADGRSTSQNHGSIS